MDWLTKLKLYLFTPAPTTVKSGSAEKGTKIVPMVQGKTSSSKPNEITAMSEISDVQVQLNQERSKYIIEIKNPDYTVKPKDTYASIAKKFDVDLSTLFAQNGIDKNSVKSLSVGQTLKIPPTRKIKNVKNMKDIAKAMGVSLDFIKKLKRLESSPKFNENEFHNLPYRDKAGVLTIGIGHVIRKGDSHKLTNEQVCELCAKDLFNLEQKITVLLGGRKVYEKLPPSLKEAVLDLVFNKGPGTLEKTSGLVYCLKSGKYEAAINKLTFNKSIATGKEMSGLSKRRLFDISLAIKMYKGKVPQSIINTIQKVYDRGIELLRKEVPNRKSFLNILGGYNLEVKSYFGDVKINFINS